MKIGFLGLLGLLFIALRLTNQIDWSWWLVLLPLYGPLAVFVFFVGLASGAEWLARKLETPEQRKRRELSEAFDGLRNALEKRKG